MNYIQNIYAYSGVGLWSIIKKMCTLSVLGQKQLNILGSLHIKRRLINGYVNLMLMLIDLIRAKS